MEKWVLAATLIDTALLFSAYIKSSLSVVDFVAANFVFRVLFVSELPLK